LTSARPLPRRSPVDRSTRTATKTSCATSARPLLRTTTRSAAARCAWTRSPSSIPQPQGPRLGRRPRRRRLDHAARPDGNTTAPSVLIGEKATNHGPHRRRQEQLADSGSPRQSELLPESWTEIFGYDFQGATSPMGTSDFTNALPSPGAGAA